MKIKDVNGLKYDDKTGTKRKLSEIWKNKVISKEQRERIIRMNKTRIRTKEHNMNCGAAHKRSVEQINLLDNTIINIFESVEMAQKMTKTHNISLLCRGTRKNNTGFGWRYHNYNLIEKCGEEGK